MSLRRSLSWLGVLMALSMAVGALCALVWFNMVHLPAYEVRADGRAVITEQGLANLIAGDAAFVVLGLVGGAVLGGLSWYWFRDLGWPVALLAAGGSLLAGLTCWWVGTLVGPGPFDERLAAAQPGDVVPVALGIRSISPLAVWPFAAVAVPLFAASLGPDEERRSRASDRRARQTLFEDGTSS